MKRSREEEDDNVQENPMEEDAMTEDSEDHMEGDKESEIQVDFEVNEPNFDADYHGIETFTQQMLNGDSFDYTSIVDSILGDSEKQLPNPLTSVVKIPYESVTTAPEEGDEVDLRDWDFNEDTYGVMSLLSFEEEHLKDSVGTWLQETCSKTGDASLGNRMKKFVEGKNGHLSLLVNMHVMNLPFELTFKLHENLWDEYRELVDKKQQKLYEHVVLISTVYEPLKKKRTNKKKTTNSIYPKFEESFYAKYAKFAHRYPLETSEHFMENSVAMMDKSTGDRYGLIMVIPLKDIPEIIKEMENVLKQPTQ